MKKPKQLLQAYKQAPWRVQLQWIGIFMLVLVLIAAIAGVYLNLSARASSAGRAIQSLEYKASEIEREINDLSTRLAYILSSDQMLTRIKKSEMQMLDPKRALYIEVPGYIPHTSFALGKTPGSTNNSFTTLKSEYTDSLWDWFIDNIWSAPDKPISGEVRVNP
ncbi:MAG: hypothetical protein MUO40_03310 [Anaerolineaceae bacterium]|nr:hypothetical protein [Anaerolineaceae bacterium]